jgi:hypothetical protein
MLLGALLAIIGGLWGYPDALNCLASLPYLAEKWHVDDLIQKLHIMG